MAGLPGLALASSAQEGPLKMQSSTVSPESGSVALTGIVPGDTVISGSFQTLRSLSDGEAVQIEESSLEDMGSEES